jgi:flagellar biosynthesis/type III secretory pathway chaperone
VSTSPAFAVKAMEGALDIESDLQSELAAVLTSEHQLLTNMSLEELPRLQVQKEAVLERLGKQTENLKACIKGLAQAFKLPESESQSLSDITRCLNERDGNRLRKAQQDLISVAGRVRDQNRINDRLIHGSMSYVSQYLTLLGGLVAKPAGYLSNGIMPEHQESGRILALRG